MDLKTPLQQLNRVGQKMAHHLASLGLLTVADLLFHAPFRYDDFSRTSLIRDLQSGERVNVVGTVELINLKRTARRGLNLVECLVADQTGTMRVVWFNQPFIAKNLAVGDEISLAGVAEEDFAGLIMKSPAYERLNNGQALHTRGLIPVYHSTAEVTQKQWRFLIAQVLPLASLLPNLVPEAVCQRLGLWSLARAIHSIHNPDNLVAMEAAKRRLAFDELFFLQLQAQWLRRQLVARQAIAIPFAAEKIKNFVNDLPFTLTVGQKQAAWQILQDLEKLAPMTRLLEGDVGSGKTVVAMMAMLNVATADLQSALMAPSELLAKQHFTTLTKFFSGQGLNLALLTSSSRLVKFGEQAIDAVSRAKILAGLVDGKINIVIGTQALIQDSVTFAKLGLIVIDEQHRFGVEQRQSLLAKSALKTVPHLLSMTATPIPRTLALALYDDLSLSLIKDLPQTRLPIITQLVFTDLERVKMYQLIRAELDAGGQVFVVCPLIDESDTLGAKSVTAEMERLATQHLSGYRLALLHGKLKAKEQAKIMADFAAGVTQVLVATAVVEVGIDIPQATVMLIDSAERFGLAQLHQYRGRVGRGERQAYCFVATDNPEARSLTRLQTVLTCHNGLALAKADLNFRGPGEVYGTIQKGFAQLKIASLFDYELMKQAKDSVAEILLADPGLSSQPLLLSKVQTENGLAHLE